MKKLRKLKLNDLQEIENHEMRNIVGGISYKGDGSIDNPTSYQKLS